MRRATRWMAMALPALLLASAGLAGDLEARIRLVHNTRDGAAQVQIRVEADAGLRMLRVFNPHGQLTAKMISRDRADMGQAVFFVETSEPSLEEAMASYPAGAYRIVGWTVEGEILRGEATFSHELPGRPEIVLPYEGQTDADPASFTARWLPVAGVAGYRVELDVEETEQAIGADLPPEATSFRFPAEWLEPGTLYTLDVMAVGPEGNVTVSDVVFRSAE